MSRSSLKPLDKGIFPAASDGPSEDEAKESKVKSAKEHCCDQGLQIIYRRHGAGVAEEKAEERGNSWRQLSPSGETYESDLYENQCFFSTAILTLSPIIVAVLIPLTPIVIPLFAVAILLSSSMLNMMTVVFLWTKLFPFIHKKIRQNNLLKLASEKVRPLNEIIAKVDEDKLGSLSNASLSKAIDNALASYQKSSFAKYCWGPLWCLFTLVTFGLTTQHQSQGSSDLLAILTTNQWWSRSYHQQDAETDINLKRGQIASYLHNPKNYGKGLFNALVKAIDVVASEEAPKIRGLINSRYTGKISPHAGQTMFHKRANFRGAKSDDNRLEPFDDALKSTGVCVAPS